MEGEDGVDEGEDAGQLDAELAILAGNEVLHVLLHVVPDVAVGDGAIDLDALGDEGEKLGVVDVEIGKELGLGS